MRTLAIRRSPTEPRMGRFRTLLSGCLVGILIAATPARAETASAYMQRVAKELMAAARTGSSSSIAAVFRAHADIPSIGLTALGSYKPQLPEADKPAYFAGLVNYVSRFAAKEAPKYPVAKAVIVGQSSATSATSYVESRVTLGNGSTYDVRWIIVRRGSTYKVRDAELTGYRMSKLLDTEFQNYIAENGGDPRKLVIALNR